jgi:transcriptional regulator with XRE-family HTH domain
MEHEKRQRRSQTPSHHIARHSAQATSRGPDARLYAFVDHYLRARGLTQTEVARRLHVSKVMVHRIISGETRQLSRVTEADFCHAMGFDLQTRRRFLLLAAEAGLLFASAVTAAPAPQPRERPETLIRYRAVDLDIFESAVVGWSAALARGHDPREALARVERLDDQLKDIQHGASRINARLAQDGRYADLRIRAGMLHAALQEAVLPWRLDRPSRAIATYDALMEDIFLTIPHYHLPRGYEKEQARLILRRATLHRERDQSDACAQELAALSTYALEVTQDPALRLAFEAQQLHTLATMAAPLEIGEWQRRANQLRKRVDGLRLSNDALQDLHSIVDYTIGVGWKRFMWYLHQQHPQSPSPSPLIERYARQASHWLGTLRTSARGGRPVRNINLYHSSISDRSAAAELEASEIDALVWCEPEEAIRRATALRALAGSRYPSVLAKLDDAIRLAHWRLGLRPPPPSPPTVEAQASCPPHPQAGVAHVPPALLHGRR